MNNLNIIGIIPARYGSTRFEGKPLVKIAGKPMIQRVYEQASKAFSTVVVATDDNKIYDTVESFGGIAVMTSDKHKSGTDRCAEALCIVQKSKNDKFDVVVNIQGDEPFISPVQLQQLTGCFALEDTILATLVKKIETEAELFNPNIPKVVLNKNKEAIYFSRSVIPYVRGVDQKKWLAQHTFYKHIGIYAYKTDILNEITQLTQGTLEKTESLEQLRWIENGYRIMTAITDFQTHAIDTPEDLNNINMKISTGEIII